MKNSIRDNAAVEHETIRLTQITEKDDPRIPQICRWMLGWWGEAEGFSPTKMRYYIENALCRDRLPQTFLLLKGEEPVGMYQLSMADIDVRPDIYPWLINVFIAPQHRGKGFLGIIMRASKTQARMLGFEELYLFTRHAGLYERYGWSFVECFPTFLAQGDVQRLYRLCLNELD